MGPSPPYLSPDMNSQNPSFNHPGDAPDTQHPQPEQYPKAKKTAPKGITRIDAKSTHGWYVRVKKNGKSYAKLFSDSKYGGRNHALKCAKKARELALETMKTSESVPSRRLVTTDKRNKSGMVGVNKTHKTNAKGQITEYYQVTWSPAPGKIKNRQWSVRKYGHDEAFRLAKEFRREIMISIYGERYTRQALDSDTQTPDAADLNKKDR